MNQRINETMNSFWTKLNKPIIALAPMAGITDSAFRQLCKTQGADVVYSEMTSADGLRFKGKKTLEMLKFDQSEQPLIIQLFGKDPAKFSLAAKLVQESGAAGIDINFGCPAKKVVGHGGGVTLMRDLDLCHEIIKQTIEGANLPVSVKLRTSIQTKIGKKVTVIDFLKKMNDLPISAIMIHGRSYEQGFAGKIDYAIIKKAKKYFPGIILANGGINTPADAQKVLKKTQADGLGIGRGIYGQPWLFKQIKDYLANGKFNEPAWLEKKQIILKHAMHALNAKNQYGIIELRKHLLWYVKGLSNAKELRNDLVRVETVEDIKNIFSKL